MAMNVSLTPELEKYVQNKVESGRYTSASEVVREALRLLEQKEQEREQALKEFQAKLDEGLAELEAGDLMDGEEVFARIREKSRLRRAKSA
jgi:antitoxin ParD1/3/4